MCEENRQRRWFLPSSLLKLLVNSSASSEACASLPEAAEGSGVVLLPDGTTRGHEPVVAVTLANTTALAAGGGEATHLTVLHHSVADPVDAGIGTDDAVSRVHEDHLEILVHTIHGHPVGVKHTEVATAATHTLLREVLEVASALELVDSTGTAGLTPNSTLVHGALAGTTAHANAVDNKALLGLVPEPASLVRASRAGAAVDGGELAVLPHPHAGEEAKHVRLLLLP